MAVHKNIYILCSDDPLLKNERSEALVHEAMSSHASPEFLIFTYSDFTGQGSSNLARLENELKDPGFFCDFRVIKIYLKDLDRTAVEVLECIAMNILDSMLVIVDLPRIITRYTKVGPLDIHEAKAAKGKTPALETRKKNAMAYILGSGGSIESMYPPEDQEMLAWIAQRCSKYGFGIDTDTASYLSQRCEGNLVTIDQSLRIMQITLNSGQIGVQEVDAFFSHDSRYTGYEFTDAVLNAQSLRALNILDSVLKEGGSAVSSTLGTILSRFDSTLNAVLKCREEKIFKKDFKTRSAFFLKYGIKLPKSQQAIVQASQFMPDELIAYISKELSQASYDYSIFKFDSVTLTLQRIAIAMRNFQAMSLCQI